MQYSVTNMVKKVDLQQAVDFIEKSDRILITTHTKPDGDAIGCLMAVCNMLKTIGKKATPSEVSGWLFREPHSTLNLLRRIP